MYMCIYARKSVSDGVLLISTRLMDLLQGLVILMCVVNSHSLQSELTCDVGWVLYEEGARCYFSNDGGLKGFSGARRFCDGMNAKMVSVGGEEEAEFIDQMMQECGGDCETYWLGLRRTKKGSAFTADDPIAGNFSETYYSGGYIQFPRFGWIWLDGTHYDWHFDFTLELDSMGFHRWQPGQPPQVPGPSYDQCAVSEAGSWRSNDCQQKHRTVCEKAAVVVHISTTQDQITSDTSPVHTTQITRRHLPDGDQTTVGTKAVTAEPSSPPAKAGKLASTAVMSTDTRAPAAPTHTTRKQYTTRTTTARSTIARSTTTRSTIARSTTARSTTTRSTTTGATTKIRTVRGEDEITSTVNVVVRGLGLPPPLDDTTTEPPGGAVTGADDSIAVEEKQGVALYIIILAAGGGGFLLLIILVITIFCCCKSKRRKQKFPDPALARPRPEFGSLHRRNSPAMVLRAMSSFEHLGHHSYTLPTTFQALVEDDDTVTHSHGDIPPPRASPKSMRTIVNDVPLAQSHSDDPVFADPLRKMSYESATGGSALARLQLANERRAEYARQTSDENEHGDNSSPMYIPIIR